MKEFRVANCLENGKIGEYAIFADGSRKSKIETDKNGNKYFSVDNELNVKAQKSENAMDRALARSFTGRIKDAIDTIKMGNGDAIMQSTLFGTHESVCYFLDREIGEEFRKKTIEGFKDSIFGWSVKFGSKNSFSPYSFITAKANLIPIFSDGVAKEDLTPVKFDTEEEAEKWMQDNVQKAHDKAKEIIDKVNSGTSFEERKEIFNKELDNLFEEYSRLSIVSDLICDLILEDDYNYEPEDKRGYKVPEEERTGKLHMYDGSKGTFKTYGYDIVQNIWKEEK